MRDKKLVDVCFGSSYFDKGKQSYIVEIFLSYLDKRSGKIKLVRSIRSSKKSEVAAREKAQAFFEECLTILKGDDKRRKTFEEFYKEDWLPYESRRKIDQKTLAKEKNCFNLVLPYIAEITMMDFELIDICNLFFDLVDDARIYSKPYLVQTRQALFRLFEHYRKLYDKEFENPVDKDMIYIPNRNQQPPRSLSQEEENRFLEAIASTEFEEFKNILKHAYVVQVQTGLRPSEILGLRWTRVDFERRTILVDGIGTEGPDPITGKTTTFFKESVKSKNSYREIPLSDRAIEALTSLYQYTRNNRFVVSNDPERVYSYNSYNKFFKEILVIAGIAIHEGQAFGPHSLRHTFATRMYELGGDILSISKILGHADIATTMKYYIHATPENKAATIALLNKKTKAAEEA